jgi:hypothetical protein
MAVNEKPNKPALSVSLRIAAPLTAKQMERAFLFTFAGSLNEILHS